MGHGSPASRNVSSFTRWIGTSKPKFIRRSTHYLNSLTGINQYNPADYNCCHHSSSTIAYLGANQCTICFTTCYIRTIGSTTRRPDTRTSLCTRDVTKRKQSGCSRAIVFSRPSVATIKPTA
jgi:hypothetical protein